MKKLKSKGNTAQQICHTSTQCQVNMLHAEADYMKGKSNCGFLLRGQVKDKKRHQIQFTGFLNRWHTRRKQLEFPNK